MQRIFVVGLALAFPLLAQGAQKKDYPSIPETIPDAWHAAIQEQLPRGQTISQTIVADLDGDGAPEWVALSEPHRKGKVWAHIYRPAQGKTRPELLWRQPLYGEEFSMVRGFVTEMQPFANVLVLVAAEPFHTGDSRFRVQVIGWQRDTYRQLVPEHAEFRSQGGFDIVEAEKPYSGHALLMWTYLREDGELLHDYHHYEYARFHYDGFRFAIQDERDRTRRKHPNPESAAKEAGAKGPDLRRRIDGIAEVP